MKKMMITGSAGGIGTACVEEFKNDYDLITVDITGGTETGDLTDENFVKYLIDKYDIDVLINNAGICDNDFKKTIKINYNAASELCYGFYEKMESGHIINSNSVLATSLGWEGISKALLNYTNSKTAMKNLSSLLNNWHKKKVKITSLEPSFVNTNIGNGGVKNITDRVVMEPEYIAKTMRWILEQPEHLFISVLEIKNCYIANK